MILALFEGGPADGLELALSGGTPSYLLVMESPVPDHHASGMPWIVVGADFDDGWPGQQRYEREPTPTDDRSGDAEVLSPLEADALDPRTVVYRHVEVES